jgi:hypothetical protein
MVIECERCGDSECWGDCRPKAWRRPTCHECGERHWFARCKGACRKTMCINNPHLRFYCPRCSEVHCGVKRQGEWIVQPHYRVDVEAAAGNAQNIRHGVLQTGKFNTRPCRGGPVDKDKDRAP